MKNLIGWRKFIITIILLTIGAIALFTGKATFSEFGSFSAIVGGLYKFTNVGEHLADKIKHKTT